jgi:hypothetical protein
MSLFSDVDWTILLVVGAFLLLGDKGKDVFRTLGRLYGKFMRMREQFHLQVQAAVMEPMQSAAQGPLPVVPPPSPPPAPAQASHPTAPLGAVAASPGGPPPSMREVQEGSGVPSEGTEMYR